MMRWQAGGWLTGPRRIFSPNQGARPVAAHVSLVVIHNISLPPDDYSGDWVEQFFVNRLDPSAHPYFATIAGLEVSAHFLSGAVVALSSLSAVTAVPGMPVNLLGQGRIIAMITRWVSNCREATTTPIPPSNTNRSGA